MASSQSTLDTLKFADRVKELAVDPNALTKGIRPNINAINQPDISDEVLEVGNSPPRDDLKLLCEQNEEEDSPQLCTLSKGLSQLKETVKKVDYYDEETCNWTIKKLADLQDEVMSLHVKHKEEIRASGYRQPRPCGEREAAQPRRFLF
ncbi:hypothetical protein PO909_021860 [Leuciscus waleckii]